MTSADRIAQLEAELELARADLDSHVRALDRRIDGLKGLLRDVEWGDPRLREYDRDAEPFCLICRRSKPWHFDFCRLAAALRGEDP